MTKAMNQSAFNSVVTTEYLATIGEADLFTQSIVDKVYTVTDVKRRDKDDPKSQLLVEVFNSLKLMTWFLNNFLGKAIMADSKLSIIDHFRQHGKMPATFKVVGFEPSFDNHGLPFYSKKIIDYGKVKTVLPHVYDVWTDVDATFMERGIANQEVRTNLMQVIMDKHVTAGKVNADAESRYRLGEIHIEVLTWME